MQNFIDQLNRHLVEREWLPGEFAVAVGETHSQISNIRNGQRHPPIEKRLDKWCNVLKLKDIEKEEFKVAAYLERMNPFMQKYVWGLIDLI